MFPSQSGIKTPDKVRELQIALYGRAKGSPSHRFWSLYGELSRRDALEKALDAQFRHGKTTGVDGESLVAFKAVRVGWLDRFQSEIKTKTDWPSPVRRVMIPKSNGSQRPLGIPTVKDRVVQTALSLLLMPIWEADFHWISAPAAGAPGDRRDSPRAATRLG